jgi:flagellar hook-associated protein 3 FlgL
MINTNQQVLYRLSQMNDQSMRISNQLSSGREISKGSDNSVLFSKELHIQDKIRVYEGLQEQIAATNAQNNISDSTLATIKDVTAQFKVEMLKVLNAGMDRSDKEAVAVNIKGIRDHLFTLSNEVINGEYIYAGSDTTRQTFIKSPDFETTGKIEYNGDAGLRTVAVETDTYRKRGVNGMEIFMYETASASKTETLSFYENESVVDNDGLDWALSRSTEGEQLTFASSEAIVDNLGRSWSFATGDDTKLYLNGITTNPSIDVTHIKGERYKTATLDNTFMTTNGITSLSNGSLELRQFDSQGYLTSNSVAVTQDATTPTDQTPKYTTSPLTLDNNILYAKHNIFDDFQVVINSLEGNIDADNNLLTPDMTIATDTEVNDLITGYIGKIDSSFDTMNIAHAKLGGRNAIFNQAYERVSSKVTHYNILDQEVGATDVSKVAMEAKALEMTYQALYSTVAKMNDLSLTSFIR